MSEEKTQSTSFQNGSNKNGEIEKERNGNIAETLAETERLRSTGTSVQKSYWLTHCCIGISSETMMTIEEIILVCICVAVALGFCVPIIIYAVDSDRSAEADNSTLEIDIDVDNCPSTNIIQRVGQVSVQY